jgi:hypothetical protein
MVLFPLLALLVSPLPARQPASRPVKEILMSFVEDFRNDPAAGSRAVFGITIRDSSEPEWHVVAGGRKTAGGRFEVDLQKGSPAEPAAVYVTDRETLEKLDRGEMNALTAMGRARSTDPAPMDVSFTPGFQPTEDFLAGFLPLTFHFWTRGFPETVSFAPAAGREVHGATMVVLYYQKGLRSAWGRSGRVSASTPILRTRSTFPDDDDRPPRSRHVKVGGVEKILEAGKCYSSPRGPLTRPGTRSTSRPSSSS